jgi:hypothetical protein
VWAATLRFLAFLPLAWANLAAAQTITDGDTLKQGGVTYRLWGIDAAEAKQVCADGVASRQTSGDRDAVRTDKNELMNLRQPSPGVGRFGIVHRIRS